MQERCELISRLQLFSKDRKIRCTFVGGDVHCGAVGRLFSEKGGNDHCLMYQIVSSA